MRVLVTGGAGFTGKALVRRMLDAGHHVVALDNKTGYRSDELNEWGAEFVLGSVTDRGVVERCMRGVDVVHHVAAAFREMNVPRSYYREVNTDGTRLVLQAAMDAGVRKFVYCSTCGVHGNVDQPPAAEDAPIQPADYYQQTKYDAEPLVLDFCRRGLKATILRPAAIFGPGDPGRFLMIFRQVARGWFPMFGDGRTLYHPLYIENFLDAFEIAMREDRGVGGTYLIADETYLSIENLVLAVAKAMNRSVRIVHLPIWPIVALGHAVEKACAPFGIPPPIHPRRVDWYRQTRAFSIERARRELAFVPAVSLDDGLRRAYEWYRREAMI